MVIPTPPIKLEGHCSAIYDNTLFVYSPSGFASIPLALNATWTQLPVGVPVSGSECVRAGMDGGDDQQALYVVGGTGAPPDYPGIQRYSFSDGRWETLSISTPVTRNRVNHGVAYLRSSSSILIYAGSQHGGNVASSETFAVNTVSPYNISSFNANGVSPATSPVLVPWGNGDAAMISGSTSNKIYSFNLSGGWTYSGLSFAGQIPNKQGYALATGSDGGKILQSFKMDVAPNTVSSVPLLGADGGPLSPNGVVSVSALTKRADSQSYPAYNGTLAPSTTRKDYSLAQDESGSMVVISGGDAAEPLAIFNQRSNGWINATELFYGNQQPLSTQPPPPTTTTASQSTLSSATQTSSSSTYLPKAPPASHHSGSSHASAGTIVGATIGSIAGLALLLLAIFFFIRHKKQSERKDDDKDRLSFQDRGLEPLAGSAYPMARSPVPLASRSVDSMGMFSGNDFANDVKSPQTPSIQVTGPGPDPGGPGPSVQKSAVQKSSPLITVEGVPSSDNPRNSEWPWLNPPPAPGTGGGLAGDRSTVDRWNRYFEGGRASNASSIAASPSPPRTPVSSIAGRPAGGSKLNPIVGSGLAGDRSTVDRWNGFFEGNRASNMSTGTAMSTQKRPISPVIPRPSNNNNIIDRPNSEWPSITPADFGGKPLGRVNTGSPTTKNAAFEGNVRGMVIPQHQSARISSGRSFSSDEGSFDFTNDGSSNHDNIGQRKVDMGHSWYERPPSSMYSSETPKKSSAGARRSSNTMPSDQEEEEGRQRSNVNSDMSWVDLNARI